MFHLDLPPWKTLAEKIAGVEHPSEACDANSRLAAAWFECVHDAVPDDEAEAYFAIMAPLVRALPKAAQSKGFYTIFLAFDDMEEASVLDVAKYQSLSGDEVAASRLARGLSAKQIQRELFIEALTEGAGEDDCCARPPPLADTDQVKYLPVSVFEAAKRGDSVRVLQYLYADAANTAAVFDCTEATEETLLMAARQGGHTRLVSMLLRRGADREDKRASG